MSLKIGDGRGRGLTASVSEANRLNVSAKTADRIYYVSRDDKLSFISTSVIASAAAGNYIYYIKNTSSTRNLFIFEMHLSSANAALWKVSKVTGTAAGTGITPINMNTGSGITAETASFGNAAVTGLTETAVIHPARNPADGSSDVGFGGALILTPNEAVAVEYDTGTTGGAEVTTEFWFERIERNN